MNILGLHFGHDASVSIVSSGKVLCCLEKERLSRIKHAIGLTAEDVEAACIQSNVPKEDIDFVAITSTQDIDILLFNPSELNIQLISDDADMAKHPLCDDYKKSPREFSKTNSGKLIRLFKREEDCRIDPGGNYCFRIASLVKNSEHPYAQYLRWFGGSSDQFVKSIGCFEHFESLPRWIVRRSFEQISELRVGGLLDESKQVRFHYPCWVFLRGRRVPACFIAHHMAHAACSYYQSPFDEAAVITHDGGNYSDYRSGIIAHGIGNKLRPISPHHMYLGCLYSFAGWMAGFGWSGAEGKLMGLAGYGNPVFYDEKFTNLIPKLSVRNIGFAWQKHFLTEAKRLKYDLSFLGKTEHWRNPVNVDLAASMQSIAEQTWVNVVECTEKLFHKHHIQTPHLCLGGGVALNCPANTKVYQRRGIFTTPFIPPSLNDTGLSMGAAMYVYFSLFNHNRNSGEHDARAECIYLGRSPNADAKFIAELHSNSEKRTFNSVSELIHAAAKDLAAGFIIGWFEGRSEIGPRALGHRSILASPCNKVLADRVNLIKSRELWRPLAPIVLEDKQSEYFADAPSPSPYMLFNARVISDKIPAITHVDSTARIQTINQSNGLIYKVLLDFFKITEVPVLLNTSFNRRGEPIVDTANDAIAAFDAMKLDRLYFPESRIVFKKES